MTITSDARPLYRDPTAPIHQRVADLLGRMTLAEKLAQLGSAWVFQIASHDRLEPERAAPLLAHGIGHITRLSGASNLTATQSAALANEIQRYVMEHTRLGIPVVIHEEICAGLMAREATVFPQALGVGRHVQARAQLRHRRRGPPPDAGHGSALRAVAGARRLPRPAVGTAGGDLR